MIRIIQAGLECFEDGGTAASQGLQVATAFYIWCILFLLWEKIVMNTQNLGSNNRKQYLILFSL